MKKVLLLESVNPVAGLIFRNLGFEVTELPRALSEEELIDAEWDILGIRSKTKVTRKVLQSHPKSIVAAFCIGTEGIDIQAAGENGCMVFHDRFGNSRSVVELTMTNLGLLFRGILQKNKEMHLKIWDKCAKNAHELRRKTLGIIGYGNIGSQVGWLAEQYGMTVLFYDVDETKTARGNANATSLESLLEKSDAITLHVDGRAENRRMCDSQFFSKMKIGAFFLNASRGITYDAKDLKEAIESKHLAGAAIDVYSEEPAGNRVIFDNPLIGLENVILTPHIGGSTEEAQKIIADGTARRILKYLDFGWVEQSPLLPRLTFAQSIDAGMNRITFLHKNQPGQIKDASQVLTDHGINIVEQRSKAIGNFGYGYFDVEKLPANLNELILKEINGLPGALNVRIL